MRFQGSICSSLMANRVALTSQSLPALCTQSERRLAKRLVCPTDDRTLTHFANLIARKQYCMCAQECMGFPFERTFSCQRESECVCVCVGFTILALYFIVFALHTDANGVRCHFAVRRHRVDLECVAVLVAVQRRAGSAG